MSAILGRFPWHMVLPFTEQAWGFFYIKFSWIGSTYLSRSLIPCFSAEVSDYASIGSPLPILSFLVFLPLFSLLFHFPLFSRLSSMSLHCIFCKICPPSCSFQVFFISIVFSLLFFSWVLPAHIHYLLLPASFFLSRSIISILLFSFAEVIAHSIF